MVSYAAEVKALDSPVLSTSCTCAGPGCGRSCLPRFTGWPHGTVDKWGLPTDPTVAGRIRTNIGALAIGKRSCADRIVVSVLQVFAGLLIGAMLPYWFSSMTMKSVGQAALAMVEEVRNQFNTIAGLMEGTARPDYRRCVEISTKASLEEMIAPGALVILTPIVVGVLFGTRTLSGVLAGSLVSGVQMAVSMSNTGGAWDNASAHP